MGPLRIVRSPRVPELDGLRGIAILLVLCHHFVWVPRPASLPDHLANAVAALSWMGADLLIVLAGFLVTRVVLEVRDLPLSLARFYGRTALRLAPAYAGFILVYFHVLLPLLGDRFGFQSSAADAELWFWLPVSNWKGLTGSLPFATSHLWAVALLLQLVLVWPVVVRWANESRLGAICISVIAASLFLRVVYTGVIAPEVVRKLTPMRLDAMAFGALAALCHRRSDWFEISQRLLGGVTIAGLSITALILVTGSGRLGAFSPATAIFGLTSISLLSACAILYATTRSGTSEFGASLLGAEWLGGLGRHSYAIYLVHYPVSIYSAALWTDLVKSFETRITWGVSLVSLVTGTLVCYGAAWVIWNVAEWPFYKLKAHIPYRLETDEPSARREEDGGVEIEPISTSSW